MAYPHLFSSGANFDIHSSTSFSDYLEKTRDLITTHRIDLDEGADKIIEANSPFEWRPDNNPNTEHYENGVLLIHGLYDSPFSMRDLGKQFLAAGFLVRAILLPGHGTVPGDLLNTHRDNWLQSVMFGIKQTAPMVKNFYLCGFSLGAALSILCANTAPNTRGLITLAPALKPKHPWANLTRYHKLYSWISQTAKWYQLSEQKSFVKYNAHAYNPAHQATVTMKLAQQSPVNLPLFLASTEDDETVTFSTMLEYFQQQQNPKNKMIVYTKNIHHIYCRDLHIECRPSVYHEYRIIDFSHLSLPISPDNWYLGRHGEYVDFSHYENLDDKLDGNLRIGAITKENLSQYKMQRLTYNPDFHNLWHMIQAFIKNCQVDERIEPTAAT